MSGPFLCTNTVCRGIELNPPSVSEEPSLVEAKATAEQEFANFLDAFGPSWNLGYRDTADQLMRMLQHH